MCNDVATKDDQYKSAQEARNDYFANMFNVHFEHETIRCHLEIEHGPKVSRSDMEKFAAKKGINSKFYTERAMWGARHKCCTMFGDKLAELAKSYRNGDKVAFTVDCADLFETPVGVSLFHDGKTTQHMVEKVTFVYMFHSGRWYEYTGFPHLK